MGLPPVHRRWIIVNAVLIAAIVNVLINGGLAWLGVLGHDRVPLWTLALPGHPSVLPDVIGTLFFLPFFTCLQLMAAVEGQQRKGTLPVLEPGTGPPLPFSPLLGGKLRAAWALGLLCTVMGAPAAIVLFAVGVPDGLSASGFVAFKVVMGAALGLLVTPFVAVHALHRSGVATA
jgi:hypothetical protein